jgi:hypothetical protein
VTRPLPMVLARTTVTSPSRSSRAAALPQAFRRLAGCPSRCQDGAGDEAADSERAREKGEANYGSRWEPSHTWIRRVPRGGWLASRCRCSHRSSRGRPIGAREVDVSLEEAQAVLAGLALIASERRSKRGLCPGRLAQPARAGTSLRDTCRVGARGVERDVPVAK